MLVIHYAVVATILATQFVSVLADEPDTPPIVLTVPTSLNDAIPACSRPCVDEFIKNNYPPVVCSDPTDLECLCRKNSTSGLTLGEGATGCVASFCLNVSPFLPSSLINMCVQVPGAMPNTHRTITVPFFATPTSEPQQTLVTTPAPSTTTQSTTTQSSTLIRTTSTATGTTTTKNDNDTQETTTAPPVAALSNEKLSDPAIAGISIVGASALILSGAVLFLCLRRRKRKSVIAKGDVPNESGGDNSPDVPAGLIPRYNTVDHNNAITASQQTITHSDLVPPPPAMMRTPKASPTPERADEIGVAIYPDNIEGSPNSQASRRTDSQLLPDKPNYSLYPEPLRLAQRVPPNRESSATVFEEDMPDNRGTVVPGCSHGVGLPSDPRALMYAMERRNKMVPYGSAAIPAQQSNTSLSMPSEGNYQNFVTMPTIPDRSHARPVGPFDQTPICSNRHCASQTRTRGQDRPTCNHVLHSHSNAQTDTSDSHASNPTSSSQESGYDDGYSYPDRAAGAGTGTRLSPVEEASSPSNNTRHSPPQASTPVTYPKLPRSASVAQQAETVHEPRAAHLMKSTASSSGPQKYSKSPTPTTAQSKAQQQQQHNPQSVELYLCPRHSPSVSHFPSEASTSTLLAKRRGDTVADKMESSLHLSSIHKSSPYTSNIRPQGKWAVVKENPNNSGNDSGSISSGSRKPDTGVFDPASHEEVRLTPTRKGPDLYLNVEHR